MKIEVFYLLVCYILGLQSCNYSGPTLTVGLKQSDQSFLIPNEETALKIGEAVLISWYGEEVNDFKPFQVRLIDSSIWVVNGIMPENILGGVPYIKFQRSDCKILEIGHGK